MKILTVMFVITQPVSLAYEYFYMQTANQGNINLLNDWGAGFSFGIAFALFNVSHWELAWMYRKIAVTTP